MTWSLRDLVEAAQESTSRRRARRSLAHVRAEAEARAAETGSAGRLRAALQGAGVDVIAEVKGASPLRGPLMEDYDPVELAKGYEKHGAAAISVLTEEHFFAGSLGHLGAVSAAVMLPTLRKDFITELYQVYEAAAAGASGVLLITEVLTRSQLEELVEAARSVGLDSLVELHDAAKIDAALRAGSGLVGINNRDLRTMKVDFEHSLRLAPVLPKDVLRVSESGLTGVGDLRRLREAGFDAVLVGTALVTAEDPNAVLEELVKG